MPILIQQIGADEVRRGRTGQREVDNQITRQMRKWLWQSYSSLAQAVDVGKHCTNIQYLRNLQVAVRVLGSLFDGRKWLAGEYVGGRGA